ncbi:glutamate--cysteine ligase [Thalassotalea mangrovi]|uniref:glutamate--cysteine ligase n=1 Tax=Thalassotalea mangrovi TaxID=2572245 RepID=UPI001FE28ABA|nr:glutamate--cysteine ligase [Thalassotalea mangrovi]
MTLSTSDFIAEFSKPSNLSALTGINRGIERETLRIKANGHLSEQGHNQALGSALTNPLITTDYSESLLEFITPVSESIDESIAQLKDIQKFTLDNVNGDLFWPMSMPCIVEHEDDIKIARYGSSNIGTMKSVYRQGLKNRYGSMMQVIAGIHFNFSFSEKFHQTAQSLLGDNRPLQDFISDRYFALIRNYKRFGWLIPYLFGSSPALCPTFLQSRQHNFDFKKAPSGCLYLEHATSLRMSDLGYTNSEQSTLNICYNDVDSYVASVQNAINLPSEKFASIGVKENGQYQQLNSNILQIENELYAPIRPKRVAKSGQKPSEALAHGGVQYVEVRAMDVNPYISTGISREQMYFMDVLLTFFYFHESAAMTPEEFKLASENTDKVVIQGRAPGLNLNDQGVEKTIPVWGQEIFSELTAIAKLLDQAYQTDQYSIAVAREQEKLSNPELTPSGRILNDLLTGGRGIIGWSLQHAKRYQEELNQWQYQVFDQAYLQKLASESLAEQAAIEASDQVDFDQFLADYFAK